MSTDFNSIVNFNLKTSAAFDRSDEVDTIARDRLAGEMQRNIRTRVDPGISRKSATVAEAIKVKPEGNRFVIYSESQAEVLAAASGQVSGRRADAAGGVEDLFKPSSGVPTAETRPDGSTGLVFKTIELSKLFQEQKEQEQQQMIEQAVTGTLRTGIVNAYEEAFREVAQRHPDE